MSDPAIEALKQELLVVWKAWDEKPSDPYTALPMERTCVSAAEILNVTTAKFRDRISGLRRKLFEYDEIIDLVFQPPKK